MKDAKNIILIAAIVVAALAPDSFSAALVLFRDWLTHAFTEPFRP